jgi:hypothetical protein
MIGAKSAELMELWTLRNPRKPKTIFPVIVSSSVGSVFLFVASGRGWLMRVNSRVPGSVANLVKLTVPEIQLLHFLSI